MTIHLQPATGGTMTRATSFSFLDENQSTLEVFTAYAIRLFSVLQAWNERARQRRRLSELDDRLLADIGVSRDAVTREIAKLPWQI